MNMNKNTILQIINDYEMDTDYPCHDRKDNKVYVFSYNLQKELERAGFKPDELKDYFGYEVAVYKLED